MKKNKDNIPDIYKCRECGYISIYKSFKCPRCDSKKYRYISPLNIGYN